MIGVPTNRTAHVEHEFRNELKKGRHLISRDFCRVIVTSVDSHHHIVLRCVCGVEVMRSYCETFKADTEHLAFDAVLHPVLLLCKDIVKGFLESLAVEIVVYRHVFASVVHPYVHNTRIVLCFANGVSNIATALCVLDPEFADALIRIRKRKIATLRVRE